ARRTLFGLCLPFAYSRLQRRRTEAATSYFSFKTFDRLRCIYVHIPKTGGISIGTSLFVHPIGHRRLEVYQLAYSRAEFESYVKFAFVRDPWDRLVSTYFFLKGGGLTAEDSRWAARHLARYRDFDSFVRGWINRSNVETYVHFVPQYRF